MSSVTTMVEVVDVVEAHASCAGCQELFTPKVAKQIYCKPACRTINNPPGKRDAYGMATCIYPGCTAPPFKMLRPDHRFCCSNHRAKYYRDKRQQALQNELVMLRAEVQRLTGEVTRLTKVKKKSA